MTVVPFRVNRIYCNHSQHWHLLLLLKITLNYYSPGNQTWLAGKFGAAVQMMGISQRTSYLQCEISQLAIFDYPRKKTQQILSIAGELLLSQKETQFLELNLTK